MNSMEKMKEGTLLWDNQEVSIRVLKAAVPHGRVKGVNVNAESILQSWTAQNLHFVNLQLSDIQEDLD